MKKRFICILLSATVLSTQVVYISNAEEASTQQQIEESTENLSEMEKLLEDNNIVDETVVDPDLENDAADSGETDQNIYENDTTEKNSIDDSKTVDNDVNDNALIEDKVNEIVEDKVIDNESEETKTTGNDNIENTVIEESNVSEKIEEEYEQETLLTDNNGYFDVTKYGADGTDKESDRKAIQKLLDVAKTSDQKITVYIPEGTYYIDWTLVVYSNTELKLDKDAVIKRTGGFVETMLINDDSANQDKGGYSRSQNITVQGGTWDGAISDGEKVLQNTLYFGHMSGLEIKDTTVKNCYGGHLIELTGVENAEISNVNLENFIQVEDVTASNAKEAIQLDVTTKEGSELFSPYDNTPCKDVTISNCTITNYPCGIGSHSSVDRVYATNINIISNTFKNVYGNQMICINNYKEFIVSGNQREDDIRSTVLVYVKNSQGSIVSNELYGSKENGIYIVDQSDVTVNKNEISDCSLSGIRIRDNSKAQISNNKIRDCANGGIYADYTDILALSNKISECVETGISVEHPKTATISGNIINQIEGKGIAVSYGNGNTAISNNEINDSQDFPIFVRGANGSVINENAINKFPEYGIWIKEFEDNSKTSDVQILNNKINGGKAGIAVRNAIRTKVDSNQISGASDWDIGIYDSCSNSIVINNVYGRKLLIADKTASQYNNVSSNLNGLNQASDGNWYYYKNGVVDRTYTSLAQNNVGWWYVKNGQVDFSYTGLTKYNGSWWYIKNGKLDFGYTGLTYYNGSWYYVQKGILNWNYTGYVQHTDKKWYYVKSGVINFGFTGLAKHIDNNWYYAYKGVINWAYTGLAKNTAGDWYYVKNGCYYPGYTGLVYYNGTWYYVEKGALNWNYSNLVYYNGTWYYVEKGKINWNYSNLVLYNGTWYYVEKGKINWNYTNLVYYRGTWYYVQKGVLNWNYTGLVYYNGTWYYVEKGKINWNYTGNVKYNGAWYKVVKGIKK